MDIFQQDKLFYFIAFVIPGFISLKTYHILFLSEPQESSKQLVDAIAYSCLNYSLLSPIIYLAYQYKLGESPFWLLGFLLLVLFIAPVVWVLLWKWLRLKNLLLRWLPHPTQRAWDYVFEKKEPCWVIISLKNGKKIAGKYSEKSFVTSGPTREQIYIAETWFLNHEGGFEEPKESTEGTLLISADIESIEFFSLN